MFDTAMHWLGFGLCHQLPARSFFSGGHQLPVCARDTGIYLGFVVSFALIAALDRGRRRSGMPSVWLMGAGVLLLALMGWDGLTSYMGLRPTTNLIRLATGIGAGFALTLVLVPILNSQLWRRRSESPVLAGRWESLLWLSALPITFVVAYWGGPALGFGYPLLVAAAVLMTFTAVNLVIVALVPRFERHAERLRDLWIPMSISTVLTIAELAAADWLRIALLGLISRG